MRSSILSMLTAVVVVVAAPAIPPAAADFTGLILETPDLAQPPGIFTVRVFAQLDDPSDKVVLVSGNVSHPIHLDATTGSPPGIAQFFNAALGGDLPPNCAVIPTFPSLAYDSYAAIGLACCAPCTPGGNIPSLSPGFTGFDGGLPIHMTNDSWFFTPDCTNACVAGNNPDNMVLLLQLSIDIAGAGGPPACIEGSLGQLVVFDNGQGEEVEFQDLPFQQCFVCAQHEDCADGNDCTLDLCAPENPGADAFGCVHTDEPAGTPCDLDDDLCTIDQCDSMGACFNVDTVSCLPPEPPCEGGQACEPSTGACANLPDAPPSTLCEADGDPCSIDHCNGEGACVFQSASCDECPDALEVTEGRFEGATGDNSGSQDDTTCGTADTIDEWFRYTSSCTGTATAHTCGSAFDTTIAVFDACPEFEGGEMACSEAGCRPEQMGSRISWPVNQDTAYYLRISGVAESSGDFTLDIACANNSVGYIPDPEEFEDTVEFDGLDPTGSVTFEEAALPPENFAVMDDPLDSATDNGIYAPGDIDPGFSFQSNVDGPNEEGPNPRGTDGLVVHGAGYAGATDIAVVANVAPDSYDVLFSASRGVPLPQAVGLKVVSFGGAGLAEVRYYDPEDVFLGKVVVAADTQGTFVGVIPPPPLIGQSGVDIGRILIVSRGFETALGGDVPLIEGLYEISVYTNTCPADVNNDGAVTVNDLIQLILSWGPCPAPPAQCLEDLDHNGQVTVNDLIELILRWGPCL